MRSSSFWRPRGFGSAMRLQTCVAAVAVFVTASCGTPPSVPPPEDAAIVALDIVPAGAYSTPSWDDVGREARMYDSLTPRKGQVRESDVAAGFKSAALVLPDDAYIADRVRPRDGLDIVRDEFHVPYITADTDALALWGVGWVSAEHSPFIYEAARRNGRIAALGIPGGNAVNSALELQLLDPSAAAEAALDRQLAALAELGPEGRSVLADIDAFVAGYNARLDAMLSPLPRWTARDVVALAAFKADWWGRGATSLEAAIRSESLDGASAVIRAAVADGSAVSVGDAHPGDAVGPTRYHAAKASNFALVSGDRSVTGHPMLIGGPQIGYMYPGVAFEVVVNSPSIHMRGLTTPAYPGYVFVGRGTDFAWTLNVAFDAVAARQIAVPLCGDSPNSYVRGDDCVPFGEISAGMRRNLAALDEAPESVVARTTVYGPVDWVDEFGGVAYVIQRPSQGFDVMDLVAFRRVNFGQARGPQAFRSALQESPQAFYIGYVDVDHITAFQTCWCVDPDVAGPTEDTRELLRPTSELPMTLDPPNGVITNWNEPMSTTVGGDFVPPEPGAFRHDWFDAFNRVDIHTVPTLVGSMNDVATQYSFGEQPFQDLIPQIEGARPPAIEWTNRSTAIQMVMSFGEAPGT